MAPKSGRTVPVDQNDESELTMKAEFVAQVAAATSDAEIDAVIDGTIAEGRGQGFESLRARQLIKSMT